MATGVSLVMRVLWFEALSTISDVELIGLSSVVRWNDKEE